MMDKQGQTDSRGRNAKDGPRQPARMRNVAGGLRLLAGGLIVIASLLLAMYAERVEAGAMSTPELHPLPLLAWLPWLALVLLGLLIPLWRAIQDRTNLNRDEAAGVACKNEAVMEFAQQASRAYPDSIVSDGLASAEQFHADVERHFLNCTKQSSYLALSIVAIDNFESLADAIGQAAVKERMHQTALSLQSLVCSQGGIFFGPREHASGHYLTLLPNTDPDRALQVSEDMRMAVEDLGYDNPIPAGRTMTASLGLAVMVPNDRVAQSALFSAADRALARSRRDGGNRVEVEMIESQPVK